MTGTELGLAALLVALVSYRVGSVITGNRIARHLQGKPSGMFQRLEHRRETRQADASLRLRGAEALQEEARQEQAKMARLMRGGASGASKGKPAKDVPGGQYL